MKIILMLLAWMLLKSVSVSAQQPLFGKIIDSESREPLAGATVIITGTTFGTTTNMEGKFTLNSQDDISTVTVSYIGYGTETVRIPNPEELVTITLDPETLNLSEVVVTGF
ncbi:MAG: carboxypeptidase-like regulatory domain-containing protein, partial [Balneolales bacterium]